MRSIFDFKNYMLACTWHKVVVMYLQYLHLTDISFLEAKSSFSHQETRKHKCAYYVGENVTFSSISFFIKEEHVLQFAVSCPSDRFCTLLQYDVELYQRIEHLIGKQLPLYKTEEEEVMVLQERVSEAQRVAKMVSYPLFSSI